MTPESTRGFPRTVHAAERACLQIDAADYYEAFVKVARKARHSLYILGWCVHRCTRLGRGEGAEISLGEFLTSLRRERPDLEIKILCWDLSMIYATAHPLQAISNLKWWFENGVEFVLYGLLPPGASHHEKIVVIDDKLAFVGGLDLCAARWDRPDHAVDGTLRCDLGQEGYPPFHDVQLMVEGEIGTALGDFFRERWQVATGRTLPMPPPRDDSLWIEGCCSDADDVGFGVARTVPHGTAMGPAVTEIEDAHVEAIRCASRSIYIENQYFTATRVVQALRESLDLEDGPEIVIVTNVTAGGWLEEFSMMRLRDRRIRYLLESPGRDRLRVMVPELPLAEGTRLILHSKLMVTDATAPTARPPGAVSRGILGSANLSDRSMGFDTEIAVVWEEEAGADSGDLSFLLLSRLLAEHLDVSREEVVEALAANDSLIAAIDSLRSPGRTLELLQPADGEDATGDLVDPAFLDPRHPADLDRLVDELVPAEMRRQGHRPFLRTARLVGFLLALLVAHHLGFLDMVKDVLRPGVAPVLGEGAVARTLVLVPLYVLALVLQIPSLVPGLICFFLLPFTYALGAVIAGSLSTAIVGYLASGIVSTRTLNRWYGSTFRSIATRLANRSPFLGFLSTRFFPPAPHFVQDLLARRLGVPLVVQLGVALLAPLPMALVTGSLVGLSRALMGGFSLLPAVALVVVGAAALAITRALRSRWPSPRRMPAVSPSRIGCENGGRPSR